MATTTTAVRAPATGRSGAVPAVPTAARAGRPVGSPARPVARERALCPHPLPDRARAGRVAAGRRAGVVHRAVCTAGVLLASAATVVGLGVLADLSAAVQAPGPAPAPAQPAAPR